MKTNGNLAFMLTANNILSEVEEKLIAKKPKSLDGKKNGYLCPEKFPYCDEYEKVRINPLGNHSKCLIVSDSFGEWFFKFISEEFSKTVKIFDNWEYKLNENIVEMEKPDVYVLIIFESSLNTLLNE